MYLKVWLSWHFRSCITSILACRPIAPHWLPELTSSLLAERLEKPLMFVSSCVQRNVLMSHLTHLAQVGNIPAHQCPLPGFHFCPGGRHDCFVKRRLPMFTSVFFLFRESVSVRWRCFLWCCVDIHAFYLQQIRFAVFWREKVCDSTISIQSPKGKPHQSPSHPKGETNTTVTTVPNKETVGTHTEKNQRISITLSHGMAKYPTISMNRTTRRLRQFSSTDRA